jgi:hypothetical protein
MPADAVIARSEWWDRRPARLLGMTGKMPVPLSISTVRDCFGLDALAMTTVGAVKIFMANWYRTIILVMPQFAILVQKNKRIETIPLQHNMILPNGS